MRKDLHIGGRIHQNADYSLLISRNNMETPKSPVGYIDVCCRSGRITYLLGFWMWRSSGGPTPVKNVVRWCSTGRPAE